MRSVLFVCSANQLRSPLAEVLFRGLVRLKGRTDEAWRIGSAGVWALEGSPAARSAVSAASARGLSLSSHSARRLTRAMLEQSDLVLVMEREHLEAIHEEWPDACDRVHLLTRMAGEMGDVEDAIGMPTERIRSLVSELERLLEAGWPRILQLAEGRGTAESDR